MKHPLKLTLAYGDTEVSFETGPIEDPVVFAEERKGQTYMGIEAEMDVISMMTSELQAGISLKYKQETERSIFMLMSHLFELLRQKHNSRDESAGEDVTPTR